MKRCHGRRERRVKPEHVSSLSAPSVFSLSSDSASTSCDSACNQIPCSASSARSKRNRVTPTEGEAAVTDALNDLSFRERVTVFEEIHGVKSTNNVEETPELRQTKLRELYTRISQIKKQHRTSYDLALLMSPKYVQDPQFLLMFLRADTFDATKAAQRLIKHFEFKEKLFGQDNLAKDIGWDDLDETDHLLANTNTLMQYDDLKDNSGRTVWVAAMNDIVDQREDGTPIAHDHLLRFAWCEIMALVQGNLDAQQRGIVGVGYMVGLQKEKFRDGSTADNLKLIMGMPFRYAALHICYDSPKMKPVISVLQVVANLQTKVRFRAHFGTHMECQYELMAFGISQNIFPIDNAGSLQTERYQQHMEQRKANERRQQKIIAQSGAIPYPCSADVLFGKGKAYNDFPGNHLLYQYIDRYKEQYRDSKLKDEKTIIAETVLMMVKESGGRFLKRADDDMKGWVKVPDIAARKKISHTFRTRIR